MTEMIVLAGGCFWCIEAAYSQVRGVISAVSGYAGGSKETAIYETVCTGTTGHAEAVQVTYNHSVISLQDILDIFWAIHDPTTIDRQGNDVGPQYRSVIFYANEQQQQTAAASLNAAQAAWDNPIVTSIEPLATFYPAEEYHQHYYDKSPENGYCQIIISPKLQKFRKQFIGKLA